MPVAAVVLTVEDPLDPAVVAGISRDPRILVGTATGTRVPIAVDTATAAEGEALLEDLLRVEGVLSFDVVSVDFSDLYGARRT